MWINELHIDDAVLEKIERKHRVSLDEAEEAVWCATRHVRRSRGGLAKVFGRTETGRRLVVVLAWRGAGVCFIVTARDMTGAEVRLYRRHGG